MLIILTVKRLRPFAFLVALVQAYSFAWLSHFCIETNKPATFNYPAWSFMGDWVMFKDLATGGLKMW